MGSGPVKKVVRTQNFCKGILEFPQGHRCLYVPAETPVFLYKSYGLVILFWRVQNQIFLSVNAPWACIVGSNHENHRVQLQGHRQQQQQRRRQQQQQQ